MNAARRGKLWVSALLALVLVIAACTGDDDTATDAAPAPAAPAPAEPAPQPEPVPQPEPAEEPEPAQEPEPAAEPEPAEEPEPVAEPEPAEEPVTGGVIGFAYGFENVPIYQNVLAPALAEAERLGFEIIEGSAMGDCEAQFADIENMIASGVDAIVVLSMCPGGYDAQFAAAQAAGIAVVTYLWDHPDADGRILLADEIPGTIIADRAIEWIDNEYQGAPEDFSWLVHGCPPAPPGIQMRTSIPIERITAHTGIEPVETFCALDPISSLDVTLETLQVDPGINMVIGITESSALGSYAAFEQTDGFDTGNVFIAGVDGELPAIELIADGGGTGGMYTMSAALDLEAVGFAVVRVSQAAITGDEANSTFQTRHVPITIDDVDTAQAWFDRVFSAYTG
ncbi:MAG: substrate-binding domain-containing protein [bacterium]|nr:substrate-binding domain-containing protein [bacterium]